MKYAILGAGAMGSVLGARLHLGGCEVELLSRSPEHPRAIAERGLLAHIDGTTHRLDIPACTVDKASRADVVIVFDKNNLRLLKKTRGARTDHVFFLGDFDPIWTGKRAIRDPWGKSEEFFEETFARIDRCLDRFVESLV